MKNNQSSSHTTKHTTDETTLSGTIESLYTPTTEK